MSACRGFETTRMYHVRKKDEVVLADATAIQNNDVHQGPWDGFVQSKKCEANGTVEGKGCGLAKPSAPDVIIIEDDGSSEVENFDSEVGTRRSQSHYHSSSSGYDLNDSSFDTSILDSSDEEDCVVIEPHATTQPSLSGLRFSKARKRPRSIDDAPLRSSKRRSSPSDLSDCEVIVDSDGKVRQDWEEAALRRRTGKAVCRAESEESTSVSNHVNSNARRSQKGNQSDDIFRKSFEHSIDQHVGSKLSIPEAGSSMAKDSKKDAGYDQQGSNVEVSDVGSDDSYEAASSTGNMLKRFVDGTEVVEPHSNNAEASVQLNVTPIHNCLKLNQGTETLKILPSADNTLTDREMLKRTEEFQHADEEEWARRRQELQKQAEEAQRERKKRKIEAERRREMEARQQRRLEEIRQSQLKEEETSGFKEQVRDRIRLELDHIAARCKDMATLLRQLGVPVEGGRFATTQQVTAAYKKALLRFHPDRAAALAKSDPTLQVEAEEKFKLVSKMRKVLPLVSSSFFR